MENSDRDALKSDAPSHQRARRAVPSARASRARPLVTSRKLIDAPSRGVVCATASARSGSALLRELAPCATHGQRHLSAAEAKRRAGDLFRRLGRTARAGRCSCSEYRLWEQGPPAAAPSPARARPRRRLPRAHHVLITNARHLMLRDDPHAGANVIRSAVQRRLRPAPPNRCSRAGRGSSRWSSVLSPVGPRSSCSARRRRRLAQARASPPGNLRRHWIEARPTPCQPTDAIFVADERAAMGVHDSTDVLVTLIPARP